MTAAFVVCLGMATWLVWQGKTTTTYEPTSFRQGERTWDATPLLRQAPVLQPPERSGVLVAIYEGPNGRRYAVVDRTVPSSPRGVLQIDGVVLQELGITSVKVITRRLAIP